MTYKDRTFCASKGCTGTCGRKLTTEDKTYLEKHKDERVSMSYFCNTDSGESSASEAGNINIAAPKIIH